MDKETLNKILTFFKVESYEELQEIVNNYNIKIKNKTSK